MPRWMLFVPVAIFGLLAGLFARGLFAEDTTVSAFEGRPAPALSAQALTGYPSFDDAVLRDGEVTLVNFFASWCPPCRAEHASLMQLASEGIAIYGVNMRDEGGDAQAFLDELGNPYRAITVDPSGRQGIEWGVVALPETFVIDPSGTVVLKFAGPIDGVMDTVIRPALARAGAG
ncbi:MAG: DsbE family thiol:disulfide interchange protein [Paracoccaceae bacterium]